MRLAFFSPLNPVQSGISDYSEDLLPWLGCWADIDLFVDGYQPSNPALRDFGVYDARRFPAMARRYDAIIYQMGNSPCHAYIYRTLLRCPGIVVLHEHVLHHLIAFMSWDRGDAHMYLNEFRYCYGPEGEALARRVILGQANVDFFQYPLSDRVIKAARGLIVHSELVRQAVLRVWPGAPVHVVPMGIPLPATRNERRAAARARLGLSPETLVVGSFGHMNPFKRLDVALRAFQALRRTHADAVYVLVGSLSPNYDVANAIRMLGLEESVRLAGYADARTFQDYLAATDICINLRYPSAGETSASVLRLMGAGLPVLVSRTGTFEELPDDCCVKIDVDECEADLLLEYLRLLTGDAALRRRIGDNARRYVSERHTMEQAARGYVQALRSWYAGRVPVRPLREWPPVDTRVDAAGSMIPEPAASAPGVSTLPTFESGVLDIVATAAAELGVGESEMGLREAARAWAELARGG
jgi:glycosyltransferase involved in cell wall biosynthesis